MSFMVVRISFDTFLYNQVCSKTSDFAKARELADYSNICIFNNKCNMH